MFKELMPVIADRPLTITVAALAEAHNVTNRPKTKTETKTDRIAFAPYVRIHVVRPAIMSRARGVAVNLTSRQNLAAAPGSSTKASRAASGCFFQRARARIWYFAARPAITA